MRSKILLNLFAVALVCALSAIAASAQVITVRGKVTLKQADGTVVPVKDAVVKFYRTDITAEYSAKTDKNGEYVNVGIPFVGVFTIAVSAPGASPTFVNNVKISQRPENDFQLDPGDGSALTLAQIKAMGAGGPAANTAATANTAEAKKKAAEAAAEAARINSENQKARELNEKLPVILKAGTDAYEAKNYDEAIKQFDLGIQADPTQGVFYRDKAIALRARGVDRFNAAVKLKDAAAKQSGKDAARDDFKASTENAEKAVAAFKQTKNANNAGGPQASRALEEVGYLFDRAESYRIALQTSTQVDTNAAAAAIEEYINAETDPAKKDKMAASLGDALFSAGRVDEAIAKYREILEKNPNNLDAMYGLGLALAAKITDASKDGALIVEARDTLQQFVSKAPDTHPRKQEAIDSIKYLDDTMKSAAYKPPPTETTKPKAGGRKKP